MQIPIDDTHRITTDNDQWVIQTRRTPDERWRAIRYHKTIEGALESLHAMKCRIAPGSDPDQIIQAIQKATKEIKLAINQISTRDNENETYTKAHLGGKV